MPSGRCRPSALGMYRRRTGCGRYVPARNATPRSSRGLDTVLLDRRERHRDRRPPRRGSSSPAAMPPGGRHPSRSGPSGHGSGAPEILGRDPESTLPLAHFVGGRVPAGGIGTGRAGHALARPRSADVPTAGTLRSPRVIRRGAPHYYGPLGRPLRRDARSPSAYTRRSAATTAAQTGLSCSVPLRARVLRPLPRETWGACASGLRHPRHGLRRDMTGSALGL